MGEFVRYHRGVLTLIDPDPSGRTEVPVKQIGKGAFSKAYLTKTGTPYVYLITQESDEGDYSKKVLSELDRSPYLPKVVDVGCLVNDACVYRMPLYNAPLKKANSLKAWKQYKGVKASWDRAAKEIKEDVYSRYRGREAQRQIIYGGHSIMDLTIEYAKKHKNVPAGLVRALELLRDGVADYGADYTFEFSPRNLATTESGHLILLDSTFSMLSIQRQQQRKTRAARRW